MTTNVGMPLHGRCLCGQVHYQILKPIDRVYHCHCETCRKAHGSAFSSVAAVADDAMVISGTEHLNRYESSPGKWRYFCRHCGTQVYARRTEARHYILRLGSLDTELDFPEQEHIWLSDKASWYELHRQCPEYQESGP